MIRKIYMYISRLTHSDNFMKQYLFKRGIYKPEHFNCLQLLFRPRVIFIRLRHFRSDSFWRLEIWLGFWRICSYLWTSFHGGYAIRQLSYGAIFEELWETSGHVATINRGLIEQMIEYQHVLCGHPVKTYTKLTTAFWSLKQIKVTYLHLPHKNKVYKLTKKRVTS